MSSQNTVYIAQLNLTELKKNIENRLNIKHQQVYK